MPDTPDAIMLRVLFFGHWRDLAPGESTVFVSAPATPRTVAAHFAPTNAQFSALPEQTRVAVNAEFADWDTPLAGGDEVAFLPPMSGG
jgi:molybdopterin converting factor small subunit